MSDTGGGHRSAAEAIAAALAHEFPAQYAVTLVDVFKRAARFPLNYAPEAYLPFTTYFESLWGLGFRISNHRAITRLVAPYLRVSLARGLRALLRDAQPDLIVSTHPIFVELGRRALRAIGSRAPFVTVVTDLFDAHCFWFDPEVDLCIVPTDGARNVARQFGMPDQKLRVVGQPVSLKFVDNGISQRAARAKLELAADPTTILLVGGGEGMGPLYAIARALDRERLPIQLVIIAGRNKPLQEKLRATIWNIPVRVEGFVTNMPDWMHASDLIITKAGPGTICEALACGLPILLSGFLPGQETGNVTFVEQSGVGVLRKNPDAIARTLREWLTPGNATLARLAMCAREHARPRAARDIARILDGFSKRCGSETNVIE
ncbi:MAG: glycosyltransferase [Chloroflexi bacterium]|nr:glycosyltransferase [Chloroflexota bacterium]